MGDAVAVPIVAAAASERDGSGRLAPDIRT
jgi:hypothetical protein